MRQLKFGLNARNIDEFAELTEAKLPNISFFTIPGILLDSSAKLKKSSHKYSKKLQVLDIVEPEFAALVPEESLQVRIEFLKIFASRCAQAARLGISTVSANFDLTRAVNNPTYEILLSKILKACSGILDQYQLTLTIPVRIPSKDISLAGAVKFIRSILCYNIQLTILLYPHEPNALNHDEVFYNNLKYNMDSWRICFEPEFGNMLTPTLLNKIFTFPFTPLPQPDSEVLLYIGKDTVDIDFYRELATLIKDVKISNLPQIVTP